MSGRELFSRREAVVLGAKFLGVAALSRFFPGVRLNIFLPPGAEAAGPPDFPLENGWHFTETRGPYPYPYGFNIQGEMWRVFQKYGGDSFWGPPVSRPFQDESGRICQASQKGIFQLTLESGRAVKVEWANILDELACRGVDLDNPEDLIPRSFDWASDEGQPWGHTLQGPSPETVEENHIENIFFQASSFPQLRKAYLANPLWFEQYGLPMAVKDYGDLVVLRCQRTALQLWKDQTPWTTKPMAVTAINGGDLAKKYGLILEEALRPVDPYIDKNVFGMINKVRLEQSLLPLSPSSFLDKIAARRVKQIIDGFSHFGPNGERLLNQVVIEAGTPTGVRYGEILGRTSGDQEAERLMAYFLGSSSHKDLLLSEEVRSLGVGGGRTPAPDGFFYFAGVFADGDV